MIDAGAIMSGCATAICCALELNRLTSVAAPHCPSERAIYTVDALHDVPPEPPTPEMLDILNRLGDTE